MTINELWARWPHHYIQDAAGNPVRCDDLDEYAEWWATADRTVAKSKVEDDGSPEGAIEISTVFLGNDHAFVPGPPVLWETLVFGGPLDQETERYTSKADAVAGHQAMCERVAAALRGEDA